MFGLIVYGVVLLVVLAELPLDLWDSESSQFFLAIGIVGAWRYSWGALHLLRAMIYRHWVFPRWRRKAEALAVGKPLDPVYLLLTSFRIDAETTRKVYDAAIREAIAYGAPATIVCSIVEMCDQRLIKQVYERLSPPDHVRIMFVRIMGSGKRDALACGFRAISMMRPPEGSSVLVIDGDSMLEPGLLAGTLPFFRMFPKAMALTTDEVCEVEGSKMFREWYTLRFAQRQVLMCSVGLSRHVLTLTGRMSAFRSEVVTDPEFIARVEMDYTDHGRLGRFKFLTGDDKSSWYEILQKGGEMLYIPDVRVSTVEQPPSEDFVEGASMLMTRWFGNMLRTNSRAILLGPNRMGIFTWWCILDQRESMWTSQIGPVAVAMITCMVSPVALPLYLVWIAFTRYIQTLTLLLVRGKVTVWYPFLLYFNQIYGSLIKVYVLFHLDRQKWTRQKTVGTRDITAWRTRMNNYSSKWALVTYATLFCVFVGTFSGALPVPQAEFLLDYVR